MTATISPIIKPAELVDLEKSGDIILIDARSGKDAGEKYLAEHLKGALFVDLEKQLANIKPDLAKGGRHPLPDLQQFAQLLGELGINESSHVVAYDDKNGANAAARFWWMMRAVGHNKVQVLDGGYDAAKEIGFPTGQGEEKVAPGQRYKTDGWKLSMASMDEVEKAATNKDFIIVDVREKKRYDGEYEPIDLIAGHIPGAINIPFTENLDEKGRFLSPSALKNKYTEILPALEPQKIIVHCGSGVTACHTILAIDSAGLGMPTLYTGSWSEWSRNDKPIATN